MWYSSSISSMAIFKFWSKTFSTMFWCNINYLDFDAKVLSTVSRAQKAQGSRGSLALTVEPTSVNSGGIYNSSDKHCLFDQCTISIFTGHVTLTPKKRRSIGGAGPTAKTDASKIACLLTYLKQMKNTSNYRIHSDGDELLFQHSLITV